MSRRLNRTGSVVRRKDGRYQGSLEADGIRRFVYGKTEREVARKLESLKAQVVILGGLSNPGTRTVNDLLDAWLAAVRPTLTPRTWDDYAAVCARHVRPALGMVRLGRLTSHHVQRLYADLQGRDLARVPSQVHAVLHRAFRLAVLWRWLPENPCNRVVRPAYHAPRKEVWTREQVRLFLDSQSVRACYPIGIDTLWTFLVATGCRLGEALALRWDDIDGEVVHVCRSLQRIRGQWVTGEPKTEAGRRRITLPSFALDALRRQRARQAETAIRQGLPGPELVFTTSNGGPVHPTLVSNTLRETCKRLGLPPLTPHGLRHLHASLLVAGGLPITAVSARLGHSKVSVTLDVYNHVVVGEDRRAAEILGTLLEAAS